MAVRIQIARGSKAALDRIREQQGLEYGELFWQQPEQPVEVVTTETAIQNETNNQSNG